MAIMRCEVHRPTGRSRDYVGSVRPVGFPNTALVCGSMRCESSALIWLESHELAAYEQGTRIFHSPTATTKVRAQ